MNDAHAGAERLRALLVLLATIGTIAFNRLAAAGNINGVTPEMISEKYPSMITPAGYAFAIWSLIYLGLAAFSIYQLLPANLMRFRGIRSLYIMNCALNCAWIYFWHHKQIAICLIVIIGLSLALLIINIKLRNTDSVGEAAFTKVPFGVYFGWVTAAALVNFAMLLVYLNVGLSDPASSIIGILLILFAAAMGILVRIKMTNYFYPLAIAWALTAIAVKQSGQTLIVVAAAAGVIASLIASLSFVMTLNSSEIRERQAGSLRPDK